MCKAPEHCGAFEGHRVSQYLIASGYECCLDTSEIARREGLESGAEMGNRRKEGREISSVVYPKVVLAVITEARVRRGVHYKGNDSLVFCRRAVYRN